MNNRASSSPADQPRRRGYRELWPWLLGAGPGLVVVASLVSAWLAIRGSDGLVAEDYYVQGLLINRKLPHVPLAGFDPGAVVSFDTGGTVHVRLFGVVQAPSRLTLTLSHPHGRVADVVLALSRVRDDEWAAAARMPGDGRYVVALESDAWRLPVTTAAGPLTELRLGALAPQAR